MSGAWNNLTMREKAGFIKIGVDNGLTSLSDIQNAYNEFALGGHIYDGETEDSQQIETTKPSIAQRIKLGLANLDNEVFGRVLLAGQALLDTNPNKRKDAKYGLTHSKEDLGKGNDIYYLNGLPQSTFLLPEWERQILFENAGWKRLPDGSYNLVNKAASKHGKALPTYQSGPDAIDRNKLFPFGNMITPYSIVQGDYELPDANDRPSTFYINPEDNKIYVKEEDLNDYSNIGLLGRVLDKVGNPLVVTTGIQPYIYGGKHIDVQDLFTAEAPGAKELDRYMQNQGLHRERINGNWQFVAPDVVVTPNGYAWGGNLYGDGGDENGGIWGAIKDISKRVYHNVRDVLIGGMNRNNESPVKNPTENTTENTTSLSQALINAYDPFINFDYESTYSSPGNNGIHNYGKPVREFINENFPAVLRKGKGANKKFLIDNYNYMVGNKNLSPEAACAILGNVIGEVGNKIFSDLSSTQLVQMNTGEGQEADLFEKWAKKNGLDSGATETLWDYIIDVALQGKRITAWDRYQDQLSTRKTPEEKAEVNKQSVTAQSPFHKNITTEMAKEAWERGDIAYKTIAFNHLIERSGDARIENRIKYAQMLYDLINTK